jgi:hypothetical protein
VRRGRTRNLLPNWRRNRSRAILGSLWECPDEALQRVALGEVAVDAAGPPDYNGCENGFASFALQNDGDAPALDVKLEGVELYYDGRSLVEFPVLEVLEWSEAEFSGTLDEGAVAEIAIDFQGIADIHAVVESRIAPDELEVDAPNDPLNFHRLPISIVVVISSSNHTTVQVLFSDPFAIPNINT